MKTRDLTKTGLIHIYCGDGKGKTTCGMGLCVRAAGAGKKVLIFQFMKDNSGAERKALADIPNIDVLDGPSRVKFSFRMTEEEKRERREYYDAYLKEISRKVRAQQYDVLFLDEALYAVRAGLLDEDLLAGFLADKPEHLEVILTGQDPGGRLCEAADYISEIRKIKHPFDNGVPARDGIEK